MYNKLVCLTNFPKTSDLLYIFATITYTNTVSYYIQTILKCRQLIFAHTDILAYPQTDGIHGIHIIIKEDYYKSGELQKYLEKHSLHVGPVEVAQKYVYEKCCFYTFICKLSPKWNQVCNYLVQGRDFLTNQNLADCVQMKININDKGNTAISTYVNRIILSKITLDNLYLSNEERQELKTNNYIIFKTYNNTRTIQVLPSLKRGKIISLHLNLTGNVSIKTYEEMRRYWKNTYGYRLPETDEDIFYLDISFFDGSQIFTYPNLCVRYEPNFAQQIDPDPIITKFLESLKKCVPTILGENYPLPSVKSPTVNLLKESQVTINKTNKDDEAEKSKLSQLLEKLNKEQNKTRTVYLTPRSAPNSTENYLTAASNSFNNEKYLKNASSSSENNNYLKNVSNSSENINYLTPSASNSFNTNKYLTAPAASNSNNENPTQSNSISEDLQKQLDFLTTSISQRASKNSSQTNKTPFINIYMKRHAKKLSKENDAIKDENMLILRKKRKIIHISQNK